MDHGYSGPYAIFTDDELQRIEALVEREVHNFAMRDDHEVDPRDNSILRKCVAVRGSMLAHRRPSDEKVPPSLKIGDAR